MDKAKLDELQKWLKVAQQPYEPKIKAAKQDACRMVTSLVPSLLEHVRGLERERDALKQWRELHKDNVDCPACNGTAIGCETCTESGLVGLYERDARMKQEGAAEAYAEMRRQAEEVGQESGLAARFCKLFAEQCIAEAQRLKEGK